MARLLIHVEGLTERDFVREVLGAELGRLGYLDVSVRVLGNPRFGRDRGGIGAWPSARKEIVRHLQSDPACFASTMVDFYGMPQTDPGAWPGRAEAVRLSAGKKALHVEEQMLRDVALEMGPRFNPNRFVPFVLLHEFEGLLFSDCDALSRGIGRTDLEPDFHRIREQFPTPEDINDSPKTAPSKRLRQLIPRYQKPLLGVLAALEIGLPKIRQECPHFNDWLTRLERR